MTTLVEEQGMGFWTRVQFPSSPLLKSLENIEFSRLLLKWEGLLMTTLRQNAIMELEKLPEDKLSFIIQIMQGVNGLYTDTKEERKEAFNRLEQLRRKGTYLIMQRRK